jgi:hypothetical protein
VAAAEPLPRHIPVDGLLEALGALLEWPAAARPSLPPAQCKLREEDLLHLLEIPAPLLEIPDLDAHEWAGEADHPSLDAAAAAASKAAVAAAAAAAGVEPRNGLEIFRDMDMPSLLLADSGSQELYTSSEPAGSGPAAAVRAEKARVAGYGSLPPPATNCAAGQSGQAPPPADPAEAGLGHAADTAAPDSDTISGASGPAPVEPESELSRRLCMAESAADGMGDTTKQKPTTIEEVEFNTGYSCGESISRCLQLKFPKRFGINVDSRMH